MSVPAFPSMPSPVTWRDRDPLAGLATPTEPEVAEARAARRTIVVSTSRERMPQLIALVCILVSLVFYFGVLGDVYGGTGSDPMSGTPVALRTVGLVLMAIGALLNLWAVRAKGIPARWLDKLWPWRSPSTVPTRPLLTSAPGLAVLTVLDAAYSVHSDRIAQVLGMPQGLADGWLAELAQRGLVRRESAWFGGAWLTTAAGRAALDRVLGPVDN